MPPQATRTGMDSFLRMSSRIYWTYSLLMTPDLRNALFEEFRKQADVNMDGQVSIAECSNWIEAKLKAIQS